MQQPVLQNRDKEDLKVVQFNTIIKMKSQCNLNIKQTQGRGAVSNLVQCTFNFLFKKFD